MGRKLEIPIEKVLELYHEGKLGKEIAEELNLNEESVRWHLRKRNLKSNRRKNKNLIERKTKEVLELYERNLTGSEIGDKLGIKHYVVNDYLKSLNLPSNYNRKRQLEIKNNKGFCKKCCNWVNLILFQKGRVGTTKEYYYSYCNNCRNNKVKNRLKTNFKSYITNLRGRLKRKSKLIPFNLTTKYIQDLWDKQNGKCFYSDYDLIFGQRVGLCPNSMSIDKIIPELGYIEGNVVICSFRINSMKSNVTIEEMQKWMPDWYRRLKEADFVTVVV